MQGITQIILYLQQNYALKFYASLIFRNVKGNHQTWIFVISCSTGKHLFTLTCINLFLYANLSVHKAGAMWSWISCSKDSLTLEAILYQANGYIITLILHHNFMFSNKVIRQRAKMIFTTCHSIYPIPFPHTGRTN